ncbi:MAG: hypothetical protein M1814_003503 [Vezdaea aestivalis]|nr:MAG: hypothetical protein M1814_003503 [Vezdaea aestivalis]
MSFGKLYTFVGNARTCGILAAAKANNIQLEIVETRPAKNEIPKEYLELNPLGKIPGFVGKDGFFLSESIAIAIHITSQNEKTTLLGRTKQDYASIVRWMSFANSEILPPLGAWFGPLLGTAPYNKKQVDEAQAKVNKAIGVMEKHLLIHTYLVGERITLADLYAVGLVLRGFENVFDKKWRSEFPNVTRWYETVTHQEVYSSVNPTPDFIAEAIKYTPPKKQAPAKKEQPKVAPKEAKKAAEEEEEAPPAPKPKHPLALLDKADLDLDDWKRKYSNSETREEALPWFWENFDAKDYSLWRMDYKYPEELTLTFMTSNLITGFFTRLEASRKYIFGCGSVFGSNNDSIVSGAFIVRGQDAVPAFDVAPDYESYTFTKLDPSKEEDKVFVEDQWSWDKPLVVGGKEYPHADGKVFK